jgi:NAD-dependent deacetylase
MKHLVVFTGAGISAESGISTFRDSNGLWENYDVHQVAHINSWHKNKALMLDFYNQRRKQLQQVNPNEAHLILAELERYFKVSIITQNVDNLHEKAGSSTVIHLHGELTKACNEAKTEVIDIAYNDINLGDKAFDGSQLRPFIVWFGEQVPMMKKAENIVCSADMLLVIGTSLQVYPAAYLIDFTEKPIYLIDPQPLYCSDVTIIPAKASDGMKMFKAFLLEGKPLPIYEKEVESDEILLACNQAIDIEPDNIEHWVKKSQRLRELQRYEEAIICQDEAIKLINLCPNNKT